MKRNTISKKLFCGALFLFFSASILQAQTTGSLTFSCSTTAPNGTWGTKHVLAVWIENSTGTTFIKTRAKYGYEDDHLTSWVAISSYNLVDAVTGATLTSYGVQSAIWDGTNVSGVVVADGTYKVFIEMGWGSNTTTAHSVMGFSFEKGPNAVHLTPTGNSNYSNVVVDWTPAASFVTDTENEKNSDLFPNPSKGNAKIEIRKPLSNASLVIENVIGVKLNSEPISDGYTGTLNVDLNAYPNGIYLVKIVTPEKQLVYKVLLSR